MQFLQGKSLAWTQHAIAGFRLVLRAMRGANQMVAGQVKKIAFLPVQWNLHMGALVDVPVYSAVVTHDKAGFKLSERRQGKSDPEASLGQGCAFANQAFSFSHALSLAKLSKQASGACCSRLV